MQPARLKQEATHHAASKIQASKAAPIVANSSKAPLPSGERLALLRASCGQDDKCVCINHAIFKHDSSWATAGVGKRLNNPCNMRVPATWKPSVPFTVYTAKGNGVFSKFDTLQDGVTACVELYRRNYSDLPPDTLVARWTDGGGQGAYQSAVNQCFI